ncbi:hypothetical protein FF1_035208 [Malus domestica]
MASILSKKQKQKQKATKLSDLKTLGNELLSSRAYINNLPKLLSFVSPASPPHHSSPLSSPTSLPPSSSKSTASDGSHDDPDFIYRTWLLSKFDELLEALVEVLLSPQSDETLKEVVLDTIMEFVKFGNGGKFHSAMYHRLLRSIVYTTSPVDWLLDLLSSKYFKYIDVRYFTYISLEKLSKVLDANGISEDKNIKTDGKDGEHPRESMDQLIHKIHYLISHIHSLESSVDKTDHEMWSGSGEYEDLSGNLKADGKQHKTEKHKDKVLSAANIAKKMKLKFTKAWLSFLRLPLPVDVYKEVLATVQAVIPFLANPVLLCAFLTRSYDIGGVISVMALSSLFILMTQHGLEYPNFYEKLYALLVPSIFLAKHGSKFFQLVDACLKSPLLPAYLAAAFAKKLSRLSISVPPSGALVNIALVHNLLRRHPSINCLVNRGGGDETVKDDPEAEQRVADGVDGTVTGSADNSIKKSGIDPFDNEQTDPMKSNAMRSSLGEIDTVRHHYCPAVSRFVLSLENDLTVRAKTTEISVGDFSSGSYATIFGEQVRRRIKSAPLAYYKAAPTSLFSDSESQFLGWAFKSEDSKRKNESADENGKIDKECEDSLVKRQRIKCC